MSIRQKRIADTYKIYGYKIQHNPIDKKNLEDIWVLLVVQETLNYVVGLFFCNFTLEPYCMLRFNIKEYSN